ncbi:MAG TPA: Wzt carbohydrate-binding domain-containing protein, partial [Chloroflexota bacterium]|nr:Wzt carbohydrate-binding domain-containing protein [Chloroflexota bacterium]
CDEALWLDRGQVRSIGSADAVLREYLAETTTTHGDAVFVAGKPPDPLSISRGPARLISVETIDERGTPERHFQSRQVVGIRVQLEAETDLDQVAVGVAIHRADGVYLTATSTGAAGQIGRLSAGTASVMCSLGSLPVAAAEYTISAALWIAGKPVHRLSQASHFAVRPPRQDQAGLLVLEPTWSSNGSIELDRTLARVAVPAGISAVALDLPSDTAHPPSGHPNGTKSATSTSIAAPASIVLTGTGGSGASATVIPGRPEDQMQAEDAFRFRWRPAPVRLTMGQGEDEFLGAGWYAPEDWPPVIRWTHRRASVFLTQDEWTTSVGITMCRPQHGEEVVGGRIYVDGRLVGEFQSASPSLEPFTFPLEPIPHRREVEVVVEVDAPVPAAEVGGAGDSRVLGIAVREVWLE